MISWCVVNFYRFWHGALGFKGAGAILTRLAQSNHGLQNYRLVLPEGHVIEVDFRDVSAMYWLNYLLGDRFEEAGLLAAMKSFLSGNEVVWDVGANCGLFSYQLAKMSGLGELHSYEPNPNMSRLAQSALATFPHVKVHPFGVSDRRAQLQLTIPEGHTTMATLEPELTYRSGSQYTVDCHQGDALVFDQGFRPPKVIKIDTEGHERAVIAGLSRTIAEYQPIVFFERISLECSEVLNLFPGNYRLLGVCDQTGELIEDLSEARGHNAVCLPDARL